MCAVYCSWSPGRHDIYIFMPGLTDKTLSLQQPLLVPVTSIHSWQRFIKDFSNQPQNFLFIPWWLCRPIFALIAFLYLCHYSHYFHVQCPFRLSPSCCIPTDNFGLTRDQVISSLCQTLSHSMSVAISEAVSDLISDKKTFLRIISRY